MADAILLTVISVALFAAGVTWWLQQPKRKKTQLPLSAGYRNLLQQYVPFYQNLDQSGKQSFESRVQQFLTDVRITGVNTEVEDLDRVLVAASAIIPIFGFPDWEYINLREVLLYPDSFGEGFEQEGKERIILGMVGTGAMQNMMILSKHELRQGFINTTGKSNTAIHEFVHLLDKTDGAVDGIPEVLMERKYILPWLQLTHKKIQEILKGRSDINPYGASSEAEFFAVVSEYFFERPDLLKIKHPELYKLLEQVFRQQPQVGSI